MSDYYSLLGVAKGASDDEIKKAYRKLAHQHHPDKQGGDEKKFKEINEAYQVLSDPQKRAQYDQYSARGGSAFGGGQGFSGGFGGSPFGADFNGADFGDLGDIFESMFGGMAGTRQRQARTTGSDLQIIQDLKLEEVFAGCRKELKFKTLDRCGTCEGIGYQRKDGVKTCETCSGKGDVREVRRSFFGNVAQMRSCTKCHGTGELPNKFCIVCKGAGRLPATRTLQIDIAPGVSDGQIIKISGAGEAGERGNQAGDLYVQIRVTPHPLFRREDDNLVIRQEVSLVAILRGEKIRIPLLGGGTKEVEIPIGFSFTTRLRVTGSGLPKFSPSGRVGGHGDLYVEFEVKAPKKIDPKLKKLLEDFPG